MNPTDNRRRVHLSGARIGTGRTLWLLLANFVLAPFLLILVSTSTVQAAGDAEAGAKKAYTCLGCHGVKHYVNSYPTYHVPRIAGQHQEYLVLALRAYRDKTRSHPTMQANAGLLSDQDIDDISAWLAAQGGASE